MDCLLWEEKGGRISCAETQQLAFRQIQGKKQQDANWFIPSLKQSLSWRDKDAAASVWSSERSSGCRTCWQVYLVQHPLIHSCAPERITQQSILFIRLTSRGTGYSNQNKQAQNNWWSWEHYFLQNADCLNDRAPLGGEVVVNLSEHHSLTDTY